MKILVLSIVVTLLLSGLAVGTSDCKAAASEPTLEYFNCELIKPVETIVGDEVTVNCSKKEKIDNRWRITPLCGVRVSVTGYDDEDNPLQTNIGDLVDGEFTFIPRIAGGYLIKVGNDAQIVLDVGENPEAYQAPVAAAVAAEPGDAGPPEPEVVLPAPEVVLPAPEAAEETGLLDFMVNGIEEEERKDGVSGLMLLLVSLLIS